MPARTPFKMVDLKPFQHQQEVFERTRDKTHFGILWEQGTGKSRMLIDSAAWLYAQGEVDAVFVVAPNGVQRNWVTDELPKHLHQDVEHVSYCYSSKRAGTKDNERKVEALLAYEGFAILAMSYDAMITEAGKTLARRFLTQRRCLYVLDESTRIKNPTAIRTKTILASAKFAKYRRILTGTPITNGPFDIYSQMKFLDEDFWKHEGFSSFTVFKQFFGVFRKMTNQHTGRLFDQCVAYKNLPVLQRILERCTSRVLKEDVLDLPPKVFSNRYYEMTPVQLRMYEELRNDYVTRLEGGEDDIVAGLAIVRLMRLQQITCNYIPTEPDKPLTMIGDKNPRLDLLADIVEDVPHQAIIWSRFTKDIDLICDLLGKKAVRYDGRVDENGRIETLNKFHGGEAQFFVGNPAACSEGLTLTEAKTVIRYTNNFKLAERLQSDDRAHRIGQDKSVHYIDLVCQGTIDQHIVKSLLSKFDVASQLTGDTLRTWLT